MNRHTIAGIILAFVPMFAAADMTPHELCSHWSNLGERIVENRYDGMPMREAMGHVEGNAFAEAMVHDAYGLPDYSTERAQQDQVIRFGNGVYKICRESMDSEIL